MAKSDKLSLAEGGTPGGILLDAGTNELEILVFGWESSGTA